MCEWRYGAGWYWNPKRWNTLDGYVPWPEFLVKWEAVMGHLALERLQQSIAALIGRADGDHASRAVEKIERSAFPEN